MLPTAVLLLLFAAVAHASISNDFSLYPKNSQACLYSAANASGCTGDTVEEMNSCLCSNGGNFVLASAACVSENDNSDLESVYSTMSEACSFSNTPLSISQAEFMAAASGTSTSSVAPSTTSGSTTSESTTSGPATTVTVSSSPSVVTSVVDGQTVTVTQSSPASTGTSAGQGGGDPGNNNNNGGSKTGIIAGAAAGGAVGLALIAAAVFLLLRHQRKKAAAAREEAHPMLPHKYGPFGGDFALQPSSAELSGMTVTGQPGQYGQPGQHQDWNTEAAGQKWRPGSGVSQEWNAAPTTSPGPGFNWETPYHSQWGATPSPQPQIQDFQQRPASLVQQPPPPTAQQPIQLQQQQMPHPPQQAWGSYPPAAPVPGGYAGQHPSVFELQGAETQIPGQAPAEIASSPVHPSAGGHYPPAAWGR